MPHAGWALTACVIAAAFTLSACNAQTTTAWQAGQPACHYGMLPGGWIRASSRALVEGKGSELVEAFPVWQPYSTACQLKPLLTPYLQAADPEEARSGARPPRPVGMLLFGDSVDFRIPKFLCNLVLGEEPEPFTKGDVDESGFYLAGKCTVSTLTIAKQHISSAALEPPYWNDIEKRPVPSITEGLELFEEQQGAPPAIVSIASNFWDIASLYYRGGRQFAGTVLEHEVLPADWLCSWSQNLTSVLLHLKESVPVETLLVFHTLHVPHASADPNMWEADAYLSQHVAQLNAAGRQVALQLRFRLLDLEMMAAQISASTLLVDNTHPGPDFMIQVLNILLNMEQAHRESLRVPIDPVARGFGGWFQWQRQALLRGRRRMLG